MLTTYRKKPVEIQAALITEANLTELATLVDGHLNLTTGEDGEGTTTLIIPTLEGDMTAHIGDYLIRGVAGEYYACKPDIFAQTYDRVPEELEIENLYRVNEDVEETELLTCLSCDETFAAKTMYGNHCFNCSQLQD